MKTVAICFPAIGPYHKARIDAFASLFAKTHSGRTIAIRFCPISPDYHSAPEEPDLATVETLCNSYPGSLWGSCRAAWCLARILIQHKVDVFFAPSFSPLPNLLCLLVSRCVGCRVILMTESWSKTSSTGWFGTLLKRFLLRLCDAALVGGVAQREYLVSLSVEGSNIFDGYDVVDNNYFTEAVIAVRSSRETQAIELPENYFLSLGRFVTKKNLQLLIEAYSIVAKRYPKTNCKLVLVGQGPEEQRLRDFALSLNLKVVEGGETSHVLEPAVYFFPYQQIDSTPLFFASAQAFILPSKLEEWGLVVNEAMASGLPVIASSMVGSAHSLIDDGINGFVFESENVRDLVAKLEKFMTNPELRHVMSRKALQAISNWDLQRFATSAVKAVEGARS